MTAAKVMDVIARLPWCGGQAADAVSAFSQVKMEDAPKYLKIPNRNVQTFGFAKHDTIGLNHGPVLKTQSFLVNGICMVILWQDCHGKGYLRTYFWNTVGRRFPIENAFSKTWKKGYSYLCMWMTSNWLERNKILIGNVSLYIVKKDYSYQCMWMTPHWLERNNTLIRCGKYLWKTLIWENQHHSLTMKTWDVLTDNVK